RPAAPLPPGLRILPGAQPVAGRLLPQLSQHDFAVAVPEVLRRRRERILAGRGRPSATLRLCRGRRHGLCLDAFAPAIMGGACTACARDPGWQTGRVCWTWRPQPLTVPSPALGDRYHRFDVPDALS